MLGFDTSKYGDVERTFPERWYHSGAAVTPTFSFVKDKTETALVVVFRHMRGIEV